MGGFSRADKARDARAPAQAQSPQFQTRAPSASAQAATRGPLAETVRLIATSPLMQARAAAIRDAFGPGLDPARAPLGAMQQKSSDHDVVQRMRIGDEDVTARLIQNAAETVLHYYYSLVTGEEEKARARGARQKIAEILELKELIASTMRVRFPKATLGVASSGSKASLPKKAEKGGEEEEEEEGGRGRLGRRNSGPTARLSEPRSLSESSSEEEEEESGEKESGEKEPPVEKEKIDDKDDAYSQRKHRQWRRQQRRVRKGRPGRKRGQGAGPAGKDWLNDPASVDVPTPFGTATLAPGVFQKSQPYLSLRTKFWGKGTTRVALDYDSIIKTLEEKQGAILAEIAKYLGSNEEVKATELSLTSEEKKAATILSVLLAYVETHAERSPDGGKSGRASVRVALRVGIRKVYNRKNGYYVAAWNVDADAITGGTGASRALQLGTRTQSGELLIPISPGAQSVFDAESASSAESSDEAEGASIDLWAQTKAGLRTPAAPAKKRKRKSGGVSTWGTGRPKKRRASTGAAITPAKTKIPRKRKTPPENPAAEKEQGEKKIRNEKPGRRSNRLARKEKRVAKDKGADAGEKKR